MSCEEMQRRWAYLETADCRYCGKPVDECGKPVDECGQPSDHQAWIECVENGDPSAIIIEDGQVVT